MTDKELKIQYKEICQNLAERKLKPAFDSLEKLISENGIVIFMDEWRTTRLELHFESWKNQHSGQVELSFMFA